jgi:hypothetical protein
VRTGDNFDCQEYCKYVDDGGDSLCIGDNDGTSDNVNCLLTSY